MTIKRDEARLGATATTMDGLSQQINQLVASLDAAVGPALRPDVPESGDINAQYWTLRSRMLSSATDLGKHSKDLRTYVANSALIEIINKKMLLKAVSFEVLANGHMTVMGLPMKDVALGLAKTGAMDRAGAAAEKALEKYADDATKLGQYGLAAFATKVLGVAGVAMSWADYADAHGYDKAVTGSTATIATLSLSEKLVRIALQRPGSSALLGRLGMIGLGFEIGTPIGNLVRTHYENNDARGVSNMAEAAALASKPNVPPQVAAGAVGMAAWYEGWKWAGQKYYGVEETKSDVYLTSTQTSILYADVRKAFPGAVLTQDGTNYIVKIPNTNGLPAHSYVFDVKTGKMRPL